MNGSQTDTPPMVHDRNSSAGPSTAPIRIVLRVLVEPGSLSLNRCNPTEARKTLAAKREKPHKPKTSRGKIEYLIIMLPDIAVAISIRSLAVYLMSVIAGVTRLPL